MERGTVKWFDKEKKYGFIESDIGKKEYFVHISNIEGMEGLLDKGQRVEFEVSEGQKGPQAVNVRSLAEE
ncbi:MAG: Cold shock-like protein CspLA [Chlamydiae bacterium]|nr:Cold shock-like protein CspLA [Chlamydiota bacterium]NGX47063.1 Cold shock-like protein CspLA [Chlamydiota bacterium]